MLILGCANTPASSKTHILPEGVSCINGSLDLSFSGVTELPSGLTVHSNIYINSGRD